MSRLERLMRLEREYRARSLAHEKLAREYWDVANHYMLEIQAEIEKEPDSYEESSSN